MRNLQGFLVTLSAVWCDSPSGRQNGLRTAQILLPVSVVYEAPRCPGTLRQGFAAAALAMARLDRAQSVPPRQVAEVGGGVVAVAPLQPGVDRTALAAMLDAPGADENGLG